MADLSALSDDELRGALLLLGERAHQVTLATEKVRAEIVLRRLAAADVDDVSRMQALVGSRPDAEKHSSIGPHAAEALEWAVAGAPDVAAQIVERRQAVERMLNRVPADLRANAAARLDGDTGVGPLPEGFEEQFLEPYQSTIEARAAAAAAAGQAAAEQAASGS